MKPIPCAPAGMLFVASDVATEHEADFNNWYDREHVEERARLDGFVSAARYESVEGGRRYLGLYCTDSLAAFTTPAYKAAYGRQTAWSLTNLDRMVDPMRRVCAVATFVGQGSGSWLSVLPLQPLSDAAVLEQRVAETCQQLATRPGFVRSYLLTPDATLSTPLPKESNDGRRLLPLLVVETSHAKANAAALATAIDSLPCEASKAAQYALLWKLFSHELGT